MDALKAVIANKRKTIEDEAANPRSSKYVRRGEIERLREEEEERQRQAKATKVNEEEPNTKTAKVEGEARTCVCALLTIVNQIQAQSRSHSPPVSRELESPKPESSFNVSNEETIRRLRAKGQPIRLFGENDKDRRLRLRALELIEEKDHERQGGQNDFKKALEDVENVERELKNKNEKGKKKDETAVVPSGVLDLGLLKTDPDKLYPMIYYALKRTLKDWEETLDERPGESCGEYRG